MNPTYVDISFFLRFDMNSSNLLKSLFCSKTFTQAYRFDSLGYKHA